MKISKGTIIRILVLLFGLINAFLLMIGKSPIDITDAFITETVEASYTAISYIILFVSALWAAWKNNSITKPALAADEFMKELKAVDAANKPLG